MKLIARTKRLQDELPLLREECNKLLAAKQDVIDSARTILVNNRQLLCQLQARAGLPDTDDSVYSSFTKTLEEWDQQTDDFDAGTESEQYARSDLNLELFRAKK